MFIRREEKVNHLKVNPISDRDEAGMADDDSVVFGDTTFNERNETDNKAVNDDDEDEGIEASHHVCLCMYVCFYENMCIFLDTVVYFATCFVYDTRKDGEETEAERLQMEDNMYALSMCRVLHIGASKVARSKSNGFFNTTYIHTYMHAYMPDYHHKVVLLLQYYKHSIISIVRYIENASFFKIRNDYFTCR